MFTQVITFLIFFAVIGCILYGRKLLKTEKIDAVFGNPERAKGGAHWVIVGTSIILLTWLYYSWDIAKGFYPKSANELCQVAKVNDSLLSLKYLFPIEERQFKSTFVIKSENKNIDKLANEIKNTPELRNQDTNKLLSLIEKTRKTIPLLTNEKLIENIPENVKLIHCELKYGGDYCKSVVSTDRKFSIIIVDGRDRVNCILNSTSSISQDGVLILDDSEREEYQYGVIHLKKLGFNELDFWGIAPGIFYNKCTSIFYKDNNCLGI